MKTIPLSIIAGALALACCGSALAAKPSQASLVQPATFSCGWYNGEASSTWDDSNTNAPNAFGAKYGGELQTTVRYSWSCDVDGDPGTENTITGDNTTVVKISLSQEQTAAYHYSCNMADPSTCTGIVDSAAWLQSNQDAAAGKAATHCPGPGTYLVTYLGIGIQDVSSGVKAMIPGKDKGNQNYTKINMTPCEYDP